MDERRERRPPRAAKAIVYYDGDCALCNRMVARCLSRGVPAGVRFAPRDGESFRRLTAVRPDLLDLDSMVLEIPAADAEASSPPAEIRVRAEAVQWLAARLDGPERWLALLSRAAPRAVLDWGYRLLARNRRWVGRRLAGCPVPTPEQRRHFLA